MIPPKMAIVLSAWALLLTAAVPEPVPDLILTNGKVFTADPARRWAEAVAVRGERITAVGTTERIAALAGPGTRRIDVRGRVVIPGLNDAHAHQGPQPPIDIALEPKGPSPGWQAVLDALRVAVAKAPPGSLVGGSVESSTFVDPRATRDDLDKIAPRHRVILFTHTTHGAFLNTAAMRGFGIPEVGADPPGGTIDRGPDGRPTGRVFEYVLWRLARQRAEAIPRAEHVEEVRRFGRKAVRDGVTSIQNMSPLSAGGYVGVLREGRVPIRVRVIRFPVTDERGRDLRDGRDLPARPLPGVTVSGTKWIVDGTPVERSMALRQPYTDRPDWSGCLNFPEAEIRSMLKEAVANDDQLLLHAEGDRAVELVLGLMEERAERVDWKARRVRLEHGTGLTPDLLARAARLGVVVVATPTIRSGSPTYPRRFGEARMREFCPLSSVLRAGIPLAIGSDSHAPPFEVLMMAVTHPTRPEEAITVEEAVEAFTRGSAYAEFAEADKGTLAPGKLADLAVLSQDIFTVPVGELPKTRSVLTLIGGEVVYEDGAPEARAARPPAIPKVWDDAAVATLEVPLPDPRYSPVHIDADYYYRIPVRPIYKAYPVYAPGKVPPGYIAWLKQQEPQSVFDASRLKTHEDWIKAGELVFHAPIDFAPDLPGISAEVRSKAGDRYARDGISPFVQYVIRKRGVVEFAVASCSDCHSRIMPDGSVIKGAQGNRPIDRIIAFGIRRDLVKGRDEEELLNETRKVWRAEFSAPWVRTGPQARFNRLAIEEMASVHEAIPPGLFARQRSSVFNPPAISDLIGVRDVRYLDRSGLVQHRDVGDLMRYAALNQGADLLASYHGRIPAAGEDGKRPEPSTQERYSDEQLYALALYVYSLKPPENPNVPRPDDQTGRAIVSKGQALFRRELCDRCHTPPHYTNNELMPVEGYDVPEGHRKRYRIMDEAIDTDPGLTLQTRRGTGYYKVPSLRGVWYRGPFGHDGSCATLEDWFDPRRLDADYVPTGFRGYKVERRAVPGHEFGLDLDEDEKRSLIAYLKTL